MTHLIQTIEQKDKLTHKPWKIILWPTALPSTTIQQASEWTQNFLSLSFYCRAIKRGLCLSISRFSGTPVWDFMGGKSCKSTAGAPEGQTKASWITKNPLFKDESAAENSECIMVFVASEDMISPNLIWFYIWEQSSNTQRCSSDSPWINTFIFVSSKVILASGYYAAFRVTLVAKALEGTYDGAVHITTDYEVVILSVRLSKIYPIEIWRLMIVLFLSPQILTIPVKALIAVGTLNSSPKHIVLPPSFPVSVARRGFTPAEDETECCMQSSVLSCWSPQVLLLLTRLCMCGVFFFCRGK